MSSNGEDNSAADPLRTLLNLSNNLRNTETAAATNQDNQRERDGSNSQA